MCAAMRLSHLSQRKTLPSREQRASIGVRHKPAIEISRQSSPAFIDVPVGMRNSLSKYIGIH
jgi:hypothetical protein